MKFEIRSVNTRYENGEVEAVGVNYQARNEDRTVNINGNFELSADDYNLNSSLPDLEKKAKEHLLNEIDEDD